jgi:hypothetical protein
MSKVIRIDSFAEAIGSIIVQKDKWTIWNTDTRHATGLVRGKLR